MKDYAAPAVSLVVLLTFGGVMGMTLTHTLPAGSETVLNVLLGSLSGMTVQVVNYWVGSSASSSSKQADLLDMAKLAANQVPAELVGKAPAGATVSTTTTPATTTTITEP